MTTATDDAAHTEYTRKGLDRQGAIVLAFGWVVALLVTLT
jgi:hypothetical protein